MTQDLPSHESGVAAVEASKSRAASGAPAKTPPAPVEASMARSRPASLSNVGRVSTASVAGDAPKSFEELERESERRKAEPKKAGAGKWIGIGVGAVGLVAVAAIVIANLPKDDPKKDGRIVINPPEPEPPKPNPSPNVDPPIDDGSKPSVTPDPDAERKAEEARKRKEAEEARKLKEAEEARKRKEAEDAAAREEAERKTREEADRKVKDEADRKAAADRKAEEDQKSEDARKASEAAARTAGERAAKVTAARGALGAIAANLAAGLDAGEVPSGGQSIQALLALVPADLEADAIGSDAALRTALARARGLGAIASIAGADAAATRAADESKAGNASGSIAAGRRVLALVKDGAPGDLNAVESTGAILERVREAARALPDAAKAKRDALAKDADDRRRALFVAGVKGVKVDDAAAIRKAMAMAAGFGATAEDIPAKARLNLLVLALKDDVAKAGDDAAAKAAADKFRGGAGALGAAVAAEVAPIVAALDAAEKEPAPTGGGSVNFATAGPGSAGWSAKPGADGASVVYTTPSGQSIEFIRIAGTETFLSASEVSIGVFRDAAFGKPTMTRLAKRADLVGPIGWQPKGQGDIEPARGKGGRGGDKFGWLETAPGLQNAGQAPFPVELEPKIGAPSASHPMQQVSARVASEAAAAIGCRLPTASEWSAAAGMGPKVDGSANRRDAAWKAMRDHMIGVTQGAAKPRFDTLPWPDDGAFVPTGVKVPVRMDAVEVDGGDDGTVWFRTAASPDGRFHDLVGNVAEWVLAPGAAAGQAQVIGGSAMSAKEVAADQAQRATGAATQGYADVGFRLAFEASGGGPATASLPLAGRLKNAADALSLLK
ncbi:MAG: hypothetical protein JNL50_03180 [Phycisphaerae bacterium]|nr:hypothetical protein [Phycisphaerae bacterium]